METQNEYLKVFQAHEEVRQQQKTSACPAQIVYRSHRPSLAAQREVAGVWKIRTENAPEQGALQSPVSSTRAF